MTDPVTVREAAQALSLSARTVQADVARGCPGTVRPGSPGRGRGALLDLAEYKRWRQGHNHDDSHHWQLLLTAAVATLKTYGGVTRLSQSHAAETLLRLLLAFHAAVYHRDIDDSDLPEEMRELLRIFVE